MSPDVRLGFPCEGLPMRDALTSVIPGLSLFSHDLPGSQKPSESPWLGMGHSPSTPHPSAGSPGLDLPRSPGTAFSVMTGLVDGLIKVHLENHPSSLVIHNIISSPHNRPQRWDYYPFISAKKTEFPFVTRHKTRNVMVRLG